MEKTTLAYLAGAMDSDGHFSIKRNTYSMRVVNDSNQPSYSERVGLKQVTPQVPELLKGAFGGYLSFQKASTKNGKPLIGWSGSDRVAAECARSLLPYLRIKRNQVELLLELRATKEDPELRKMAYWFDRENPMWRKMPMITSLEVTKRMGYAGVEMVSQAVRNGSLLSLPFKYDGKIVPRFPSKLVDILVEHQKKAKDNRGRCRPPQLVAWRERLWNEVRVLNKIGTGDHPISMRTGIYAPKK